MDTSIIIFYRWENWGSKRLSELSKVTQLAEKGLKLKLITLKPKLLHSSLHLLPGTTTWYVTDTQTIFVECWIDEWTNKPIVKKKARGAICSLSTNLHWDHGSSSSLCRYLHPHRSTPVSSQQNTGVLGHSWVLPGTHTLFSPTHALDRGHSGMDPSVTSAWPADPKICSLRSQGSEDREFLGADNTCARIPRRHPDTTGRHCGLDSCLPSPSPGLRAAFPPCRHPEALLLLLKCLKADTCTFSTLYCTGGTAVQ